MHPEDPYAGIRVIDLSQGIAGPYASMLLAQHGADVIKVEPIGTGDWARHNAPVAGGNSALSVIGNAGKRSLSIDLKTSAGRAILDRLIEGAHVFIQSFRPGVIERLGYGHEALLSRRPDLIYLSVSGFGQSGPLAKSPAIDPVLQAYSGLMSENRDSDGTPRNPWGIPIDLVAGLYAHQALAAALYGVRATSRGRYIDASLLHAAAWLSAYPMMMAKLNDGVAPPAPPTIRCSRTRDGWIVLGIRDDRAWTAFCKAVGRPGSGSDPRFATPAARRANAEATAALMDEVLAHHPTSHWEALFVEAGISHSIVNSPTEFVEQAHVRAMNLFRHAPQPGLIDPLPIPGLPGVEHGRMPDRDTAPPAGGDTVAVLAELGYSEAEIASFEQAGAVAQSALSPR